MVTQETAMFNGGYVDSGPDQTATGKRAFTFNSDYSVRLVAFEPSDNSILFEDSDVYWTQEMGGLFAAVSDMEDQGIYDGAAYDAILLMFINTNGELVESLALYDAHTGIVIYISNYNVFIPGTVPTGPAPTPIVPSSDHTPMVWDYDEEFEEMLMGVMWSYTATEEPPKAFDIPEYSDVISTKERLIFNTDYTLEATLFDSSEESEGYDVGYLHVYIVFEEDGIIEMYEHDGVTYEVNHHYFIDSEGNLIESIRFYDFDTETYHLVSNINVYEAISP